MLCKLVGRSAERIDKIFGIIAGMAMRTQETTIIILTIYSTPIKPSADREYEPYIFRRMERKHSTNGLSTPHLITIHITRSCDEQYPNTIQGVSAPFARAYIIVYTQMHNGTDNKRLFWWRRWRRRWWYRWWYLEVHFTLLRSSAAVGNVTGVRQCVVVSFGIS